MIGTSRCALTGQFVSGKAVLRASGYATPAGPIIASSAVGTALLAPFGCHGLNLAEITAAICTGYEAHKTPGKRYWPGCRRTLLPAAGNLRRHLVLRFFRPPKNLIAALTGAMAVPSDREAALVSFLTTASGMSLLGLPAAFRELIFGLVTHLL